MSRSPETRSRREVLSTLAVAGGFAWMGRQLQAAEAVTGRPAEKKPASQPEEVAPAEDLMR